MYVSTYKYTLLATFEVLVHVLVWVYMYSVCCFRTASETDFAL